MSEIGLILALGCALISGVALLCKHRGAVDAPDVAMRSPLRSASALFRSRWWAIGFALAFFAWCLHVAALSMAPLSLVQAVIAGGLALLAIPARRWFGIAVSRREVVGMVLCASGLVFLALTAGHGRPGGGFAGSTMLAFEGGTLALGGLLLWASAQHRHRARGWLLLAVAAGTSLGVSDVALKALAETVPARPWRVQPLDRRRDPRRDRRLPGAGARTAARGAGRRDRRLLRDRDSGGDRGGDPRVRRSARLGRARRSSAAPSAFLAVVAARRCS